ncbi:MAG: molybdopterin-binding protein [Myxococcota bacterium]|jgi:FAD synthetase|nr:molybdopterin-binding protein [Myxococcota bacterium]
MPTAGFLVIGNEILSGKVVDTNSPFLAKELRKIGVDLERILTIPDEIDIIADEVRTMSAIYDYVITSGGIGPTHDDLTMDGVAKAFGLPMVLDEDLCKRIEDATGDHFNESMRKMAILPKGAGVQESGDLWFPLICVNNVYVLPGIPRLFEAKFPSVAEQMTGIPVQLKRVYVKTFESEIASYLHDLLEDFDELMLGSYPRMGEEHYRVLLTLESRDMGYLERALEALLSRLPAEIVHKVE